MEPKDNNFSEFQTHQFVLTLFYAKQPRLEFIQDCDSLDKAIAMSVCESRHQLKPIGIVWENNPQGRSAHRLCKSGLKEVPLKEFIAFDTLVEGAD